MVPDNQTYIPDLDLELFLFISKKIPPMQAELSVPTGPGLQLQTHEFFLHPSSLFGGDGQPITP
jgi:hypothetical protein